MVKILFVCHGNICRSPMAEFIFKDFVNKKGIADQFYIASCATSTEEIGNPVHYGTKRILNEMGIDCRGKTARQITKKDYLDYDFIIAMDYNNISNLRRFVGDDPENKVYLLLDFVGLNRSIRDPWYTGNFEETKEDVITGIEGLFEYLIKKGFVNFI